MFYICTQYVKKLKELSTKTASIKKKNKSKNITFILLTRPIKVLHFQVHKFIVDKF